MDGDGFFTISSHDRNVQKNSGHAPQVLWQSNHRSVSLTQTTNTPIAASKGRLGNTAYVTTS